MNNDLLINGSVEKDKRELALVISFNNSYYVAFPNEKALEMNVRIFSRKNNPIRIFEKYNSEIFEKELNRNNVPYFKVRCENKIIFIPKDRFVCVDEIGFLDGGNDILLRSTTGEYFQICTNEKIRAVSYISSRAESTNNFGNYSDYLQSDLIKPQKEIEPKKEQPERKINVPKIDLGF